MRELWIAGALYDIIDHDGRVIPDGFVHLGCDRPDYTPGGPELYVHRGFVSWVTCSAADWLAHADAILAAHPVERVRLSVSPEGEDWWDNGAMLHLDGPPGIRHDRWPGVVFELPPADGPSPLLVAFFRERDRLERMQDALRDSAMRSLPRDPFRPPG